MEYAIVNLCMLKEHYVIGACICAYTHRLLIPKQHRNIKLVVMCDHNIYKKWHDVLELYYDQVIEIDLIEFPLSEEYVFAKNKYSWMPFSINKWQCLKLVQFNKVLLFDVDMLPLDTKFYDIFDFPTPAVHHIIKRTINHQIVMKNDLANDGFLKVADNFKTYANYVQKNTGTLGSCDGGIVLLEPSMQMYDDYIRFVNEIYKNGIYSTYLTGPDETSLFFFLTKNMKVYKIPSYYTAIPWDDPHDEVEKALVYNFLSFVKPWLKTPIYQWDEEILWYDLFNKMPYNEKLYNLWKTSIIEQYQSFLQLPQDLQKKYFNIVNLDKLNEKTLFTYKKTLQKYGILNIKSLKNLL